MSFSTLLDGLNPQQLAAVTLPHESVLILAGAGSGKTRVLTTRIAWLIQTGQVNPRGLVAVTFTNKAAREMLTRIAAMLPIDTRGMWVGTFHGLCNRLLRAHYRDAALPQTFQILDSQDQLSLIKRLLKGLNVDEERYPPRDLQYFINQHKEAGLRSTQAQAWDERSGRFAELYAAYDEQCNREGVVDFAELLLRSFELLSRHELLRRHYQERFSHILVDEFQDTNRLQYGWLKLLAAGGAAVFAVGDDDQSIYAFRGASSANMFEFEREFAQGRVIRLEQNYRSHGNILAAANALIGCNRARLGKNLWTAEGLGEPLRAFEAATDQEEAAFIVDEVKALHRDGVPHADIALLYRSNAQSRVLEHALFTAGIPYRVYGGLRFFERQEIKHALAYLRLIANPDDDGALLRVINFPARGIGARSLEQLQDIGSARGISLWQAARVQSSAGKSGAALAAFIRLIEQMASACEPLALAEAVEHVIAASGLRAHYQTEREGQDRIENLDELVNAAALFDSEAALAAGDASRDDAVAAGVPPAEGVAGPEGQRAPAGARFPVVDQFLAHAALEAGEHQAEVGADALQLMTAHSAKGLEFHSVFISGLEEGLFPHENAIRGQDSGAGRLSGAFGAEGDGLEEERRLMYVAMTRARRRLYLTHAQSRMLHGQTRYNIASRFLREIPANLIRSLNAPRVQTFASAAPAVAQREEARPVGAASSAAPWRVGQSVVHPKFGQGVIVSAEGRGADARVQVNFRQAGMKWLALEYARLSQA